MSIRLEMLQVARLAPRLLGDSAPLVEQFFRRQQNPDGGFKDRSGRSDLYYTVFALDGLLALQAAVDAGPVHDYLRAQGDGAGLDFVHLCCLARSWATLAALDGGQKFTVPAEVRNAVLRQVESYRTPDGGYHALRGNATGSAYGCFLAVAAYQDLHVEMPEPLRWVQCLKTLETADGAWMNERIVGARIGSTNATAAAITALRQLRLPINPQVGQWLLERVHAEGGFLAAPAAPIPDLLSTATALHALTGLEVSFEGVKEACLDFVDTLWTNEGGFYGHWGEDTLDAEYTYYGLLALGHLSL